MVETSWNLRQENSVLVFLRGEMEKNERLGKKTKKGSVWGAEQGSWTESFQYSIL